MARDFNPNDDQQVTSVVQLRNYPITMACWFSVDSHPATQETALMAVSHHNSNNFYMLGLYDLLGGDDSISGFVNDGGTVDIYSCSATISTGTWYHACARFTDPTTRDVFHNGTGDTDTGDGSSYEPGSLNRFTIGAIEYNGSEDFNINGQIAWPTVWRAALTNDEIDALAAGIHPMCIRPQLQWGSWANQDFWAGNWTAGYHTAFTNSGSGTLGLGADLTDNGTSASTEYGPSVAYGFIGPL